MLSHANPLDCPLRVNNGIAFSMTVSAWPNSVAISYRSKAYSRNKAVHLGNQTVRSDHIGIAAKVAASIRTGEFILDSIWRNVDPVFIVNLARHQVAVLELRFRRRAILVVAARQHAVIRPLPCRIEPLMDLLIVRRMLSYGGAGGENEAAPGHTSSHTRNTRDEIPASHGGPAINARNPMPRNFNTWREEGHPKHINNRPRKSLCEVCCGSIASVGPLDDFRSSPANGRRQDLFKMRAGMPEATCSPDGMFPVELAMASLDVLSRTTDRRAGIFFRPSWQRRAMADDDHNSMSAILSDIRRAFAPEPSRVQVLSRALEPSRAPEPARVVEPPRLPEPTRYFNYRWEGMRGLL